MRRRTPPIRIRKSFNTNPRRGGCLMYVVAGLGTVAGIITMI